MHTLNQFKNSRWSLVVYCAERAVFRSEASDLRPLIRYVKQVGRKYNSVTVFDKYIGRAAALLLAMIEPDMVYVGTLSNGGAEALNQHRIKFHADNRVEYLMGIASEQMCQWEKLAIDKTPEQLWELLNSET